MDIAVIRLHNLRRLVSRHDTQQEFAAAAGISGQYLNQLLMGRRNLGEKTARKIERALRLTPGELDADGTSAAAMALPVDQMQLLDEYARLSPAHQQMVRETITAYRKLELDP
ncbi:MAG TPA: helix-turn-helix transcriptional regulator [Candidatus Competibacter sp.]|nr:helix-turn-helix transcriptional regulator [Candidatus Competibacter sp.]